MSSAADVLVVGAGPAGATVAIRLAQRGHDVVLVERRIMPRDKTCGDAVSPRAFAHLTDLGVAERLDAAHRHHGLRLVAHGREADHDWRSVAGEPSCGITMHRRDLDHALVEHARACGVTVLEGHEAIEPIVERGFVRGAVVTSATSGPSERRSRFVVVADGANSRFGRAIGTFRTREWPYATAIRSYWESPRSAEPRLEIVLDVYDRDGQALPGAGWVFPLGDGTVNVGVGVMSTYRDFTGLNTTHLLDAVVHTLAARWGLDPDRPLAPPASGRIPMGGSVGPKAGPTFLVVGDASASVNPITGDGIEGALSTGAVAAEWIGRALEADDPAVLQQYPKAVEAAVGRQYSRSRSVVRALGHPAVMHHATKAAMRSPWLVRRALRPSTP